MTPVEKGRTSSGRTWVCAATISVLATASAKPISPVAAFALPELISKYRGLALSRFACANRTGAALNWFLVKIEAAVVVGEHSMRATSSRPEYRIPAAAAARRIPATGSGEHSIWPTGIRRASHDTLCTFYPSHKDKAHCGRPSDPA